MFEISGTLPKSKRTVSNEVISAMDLIKEFDLPINFQAKRQILSFELGDGMVKKDRLNGGVKHQDSILLRSLIAGSYNGSHFQIQYYRTAVRKRENGQNVISYEPHHVEYQGQYMAFSLDYKNFSDDLERMVFFMLSPKCADSPLRNPNDKVYYQINDVVSKATEKMAARTRMVEVMTAVMKGDDMHHLRTKAAGMGISEKEMEDMEVRNALMDLAEQDVERFWKQFENIQTSMDGLVQRALELGVIVEDSLGAGVNSYKYSDAARSGTGIADYPIVEFMAGQDGRMLLKQKLSSDPDAIHQLNSMVEDFGVKTQIATKLKQDMFSGSGKSKSVILPGGGEMNPGNEDQGEEDPYEVAAAWGNANKLFEVKKDKLSYKHDSKTIFPLGIVNPTEEIVPQVAYHLAKKENKGAFEALTTKMES